MKLLPDMESPEAPLTRIKEAQKSLVEKGEEEWKSTLRKDVFTLAHGDILGGHKGRDAVCRKLKEWEVGWPKMKKDISSWVSECLICQRDRLSMEFFK
ncbi:hypothetical protein ADUPG1_004980, partial [Aduncisulcus paluster]